jgi:hypothetical protein
VDGTPTALSRRTLEVLAGDNVLRFELLARIRCAGRGVSSRVGVIHRTSAGPFKEDMQASTCPLSVGFSITAPLVGRTQELSIQTAKFLSSSFKVVLVSFCESMNREHVRKKNDISLSID